MEMEKSFYVVTFTPAYFELMGSKAAQPAAADDESVEPGLQRMVVAITQGGFGQDVVDDEMQAKERFLEYLFSASNIDIERTAEVFDHYFTLEPVDEIVDLDDEF